MQAQRLCHQRNHADMPAKDKPALNSPTQKFFGYFFTKK